MSQMPTSKRRDVFHFYGPVTQASIQNLRNMVFEAVYQHDSDDITLVISSEGGDLNSGFTAYQFLRSLPATITTVNMCTVESIAVPIYLAGDQRMAMERSRFLLHSFNWTTPHVRVDQPRLMEYSHSLLFDMERYAQIFNERTKGCDVPVDILKHLKGDPLIIDASSAAANGLVTAELDSFFMNKAVTQWWIGTV